MTYPTHGLSTNDPFESIPLPSSGVPPAYNVRPLKVDEPLFEIRQRTGGLVRERGLDHPLLTETLRQQVRDAWHELALLGTQIRRDLETGNGFALVEGWPDLDSDENRGLLFLSLAVFVGMPIPHDAQYGRILWSITPLPIQGSYSTFSQNNQDAPLHTDGAYKREPPDFVGLYMATQADQGGESWWLDGHELLKRMGETEGGQTTLQALQQPYPIRVPTAYTVNPHVPEYIDAPILSVAEERIRFRKDTFITGAAERGLKADRLEALEIFSHNLDEAEPSRYRLPHGSLFFLNNRRILHGRSAFRGQRLAHRVWLRA